MTRIHLTLSIDIKIRNMIMEKYGGKISQITQEFYERLLFDNPKDLDKQIIKKELEEMKEKLRDINNNYARKEQQLKEIEEKEHQEEINKLEEEKKIKEQSKTCLSCGRVSEDTRKLAKNVMVCKSCFFSGKFSISELKAKAEKQNKRRENENP